VIGVSPDFMVSPTVNVAIVIQPVPKLNVDDKLVIVVQAEMVNVLANVMCKESNVTNANQVSSD